MQLLPLVLSLLLGVPTNWPDTVYIIDLAPGLLQQLAARKQELHAFSSAGSTKELVAAAMQAAAADLLGGLKCVFENPRCTVVVQDARQVWELTCLVGGTCCAGSSCVANTTAECAIDRLTQFPLMTLWYCCHLLQDLPQLSLLYGLNVSSFIDTQLCFMLLEAVRSGGSVKGALQRTRLEVLLASYGLEHPNKMEVVEQMRANMM